jgi:hypothetical protein
MGRVCSTNGGLRNAYRILVGKLEGKRPHGTPRLGGWIILKWISGRYYEVVCTGLIWLRIGTNGGLL